MIRFVHSTPIALCLLAAPAAAQPVTINRPAVTVFADAFCMVKKRESRAADLGPLEEVRRGDGCVQLKDQAGGTLFITESALSARAPTQGCRPRPGGQPIATDMAGVSAGASKQCP